MSISLSLIAAFIPLLFMRGIVGRLFREFSVTLTFAIVVSTVVSLTVTPMICAHFVREAPSPDATWLDRRVEGLLQRLIALLRPQPRLRDRAPLAGAGRLRRHRRAHRLPLHHHAEGLFPAGRHRPHFRHHGGLARHLLRGDGAAAADGHGYRAGRSGRRRRRLIGRRIRLQRLGQSAARLFISLKPLEQRDNVSTQAVIDRLRAKLSNIPGMRVFLVPSQDLRAGGRQSKSQYQFTLWSPDIDELQDWVPKVLDRVRQLPGIIDVTTDREQGGLQANVVIDRDMASRLGVRIQDIDNALNDAFSQRQISTIYSAAQPVPRRAGGRSDRYQRDPTDLSDVYVPGNGNSQVPLSAVAHFDRGIAPLVVNHQGQFPSITITYNIAPDMPLETATARIAAGGRRSCTFPTRSTPISPATCRPSARPSSAQPLLILAALLAVYIVLGVLYESLAHPLTIISTLPSAGLGALLALQVFRTELTVIAFIGIILADRHRQEERHHAGRLRARRRTPARAAAGDARSTKPASSASARS